MKYIVSIIGLLISPPSASQEIKVNPGKWSNYYHMNYELVAGNYHINAEYGFNDDG